MKVSRIENRQLIHPFIQPGDPTNQYRLNLHTCSTAILRNLYHDFPWTFCRPPGPYYKELWGRAKTAMIQHGFLTPTLDLTPVALQYLRDHQREFTADV